MCRGDILLVDDDATYRSVVAEVLKGEGCTVREAATGREALDLIDAHAPDLILTDLNMPTMSGWEFCDELRRSERFARIPLAVVSGVAAMVAPGTLTFSKPLALPDLLALVERILPR